MALTDNQYDENNITDTENQVADTQELSGQFSPIYSFTQKTDRLAKEGKIEYPKYRTLSQEQGHTYLKAKDLPAFQRKQMQVDLQKSSENDFATNAKNAAIVEWMDILSGKGTELALGNMLVTEDYAPLVPALIEGYGAETAAQLAKKGGSGFLSRLAAGAAGGALTAGVITALTPTETATQEQETAGIALYNIEKELNLTDEDLKNPYLSLMTGKINKDQYEYLTSEIASGPFGYNYRYMSFQDFMSGGREKLKEKGKERAREGLKGEGFTDAQIEEMANRTGLQRIGYRLLADAMNKMEYNAAIAPSVDEDSIAARGVQAAASMGEYMLTAMGASAIARKTAKAIKTPKDRFGRKAAEFTAKKGTPYEDVVDRYSRIVGTKTGSAAATTEMSMDIMGQGALESVRQYIDETGDTELRNYEGDIKNVALDVANTHINNIIENKLGVGKLFKNPRLSTKYGEWLNGLAQEFSQGEVTDVFEWIKGNKTALEVLQNIPNNAVDGVFGGFGQGAIGTGQYYYFHNKNVNDLTGVIMGQSTKEKPIDQKKARQFAENLVNQVEEEVATDLSKEITDFTGMTQYQGKIYETIRDNVKKAIDYQREQMKDTLEGSKYDDMTEDELAQHIESVAQDETDRTVIEALESGTPLSESPRLKGETIDGTYYLEGSDYAKETAEKAQKDRETIRKVVYAKKTADKEAKELAFQETEPAITAEKIKESIKNRFNLDENPVIEDYVDELLSNGAEIDANGFVTLYHRTSKESQDNILKTGVMYGKENDGGIFFSTKATEGQNQGFGDSVIAVKYPIENIVIDDVFGDEVHVKIPSGKSGLNVKDNLIQELETIQTKLDEIKNALDFQDRQRGKGGAYDARTRSITLGSGANVTTLPHELAHYWIDKNFKWARSGKASQAWLDQWRAVEKWLGIDPEDKYLDKNASEKFARAYERFLGEEQLPLVLKKSMADFRDFVLDHYDYELDDAKGLQDKLGRPIHLNEDVKNWFKKSVYDSYMSASDMEVVNQRLAQDDQESKEVEPAIEKTRELEKVAQNSPEISEVAPTGSEIQTDAKVSNDVILGKKTIGGGEEKESKGAIAGALGKTYESTSWDIQDQMVSDYLETVSIDEAMNALEDGTYPDKIDPNFLRQALVEKLLDEGREIEAAALIEETADDFTQAAQTLQAARRINTPFTNAIHMLTIGKATKLAEARYGKNKDAVKSLDAAINALVAKYEQDFMNAKTDEERELVYATMQDEAIRTIGTLEKDKTGGLDFQDIEDKEDRKQAKELRKRQIRRASINGYRSRAKRALKQALGLEPTREQVRQIKKLSVKVAREIKDFRKAVKENKTSAIDPTKILEAQNELNEYMNKQLPPRVLSNAMDAINSYMMANMLWNPATNVFNLESTWVQMIPHMLATRINYGKGTIPWKEKIKLIKQALALQAKTGYNIFSLQDFFDKKTIWAEKFYEPTSTAGKAIRFPLTILGLADTMNKGVVFLQHADAMATKQAKEEGKKNNWNKEQITQRAKELFYQALNTDPRTITRDGLKIRESAVREGEEATFTQDTKTAQFVNKFRKMLNFGAKTGLGNVIMPFTTTIANIAEDTVLNYALGSVRGLVNAPKALATQFDKTATAEMKKEAWNKVKPETKNVIKNIIGVLMLLGLALKDPDDDSYVLGYDRQTEVDKDIRQNRNAPSGYAVRIGNRWVDLDLFGIGSPWARAYLIAKRHDFSDDGWVKGIASIIDLVPGIGEIEDIYKSFETTAKYKSESEALMDFVGGKGEDILERLILAQALFNEIGNITDTTKRVGYGGVKERVLSKIPYARKTLEERTSKQTGEPIKQTDTVFNLITGQRVKQYVESTPADRARYELAKEGSALNYQEGRSKLKDLGKDSPAYKKAVARVRRDFTRKLNSAVQTSEYQNLDTEQKKKFADKLHKEVLEDVKEDFGLAKKKPVAKKKKKK